MKGRGKTPGIVAIPLSLVICLGGLGIYGCGKKAEEPAEPASAYLHKGETEQKYQTQRISGKIVDIDEDSFALVSFDPNHYSYNGGCNFEFENIRILGNDGRIYKLIHNGPTSYKAGDRVKDLGFEKLQDGKISYYDLARPSFQKKSSFGDDFGYDFRSQHGSIEADGIIPDAPIAEKEHK